jgi:hypothetical protein
VISSASITALQEGKEGIDMNVKKKVLAAVATSIAVLGIGIPAASASAAAPVTQVIKVKAVTNPANVVLTPTSYTFLAALWQGKKDVGQVTVTCYFTSQSSPGNCGVAAYFYGTGFIFANVKTTTSGAVGSVVGGTGSFAHAQGTILVVGPGNVSWVTLRFSTAR